MILRIGNIDLFEIFILYIFVLFIKIFEFFWLYFYLIWDILCIYICIVFIKIIYKNMRDKNSRLFENIFKIMVIIDIIFIMKGFVKGVYISCWFIVYFLLVY